jgi:DNA-binding beta-propeller fold protein YncE
MKMRISPYIANLDDSEVQDVQEKNCQARLTHVSWFVSILIRRNKVLKHEVDTLLERLQQQVERRHLDRIAVGATGTLLLFDDADPKKKKPTTQPPKSLTFAFDKTLGTSAYDVPGLLPYPIDVATDSDNNLYVLDDEKRKIVKFNSSGELQGEFGSFGRASGELEYPSVFAVGRNGWMYVADYYYDHDDVVYRLQVLNETGDFVARLLPDAGPLGRVLGIAVTNHVEVFATVLEPDATSNEIIKWAWNENSEEFTFVQRWPVSDLAFLEGGGLAAIDDSGRLYAGYSGLGRVGVRVFDTTEDCRELTTYSVPWDANTGYFALGGIAVDAATGAVFVTQNHHDLVQRLVWNGDSTALTYSTQFGISDLGLEYLQWPGGVTIDANGDVHIADTGNGRVVRLTTNLTDPSEVQPETGPGEIFSAWAVTQDDQENYYILDGRDYSIHKLNNAGNGLLKWGGAGSDNGRFDSPFGIAVKGDRIYVSDTDNNRIQIFDTSGEHKQNLEHPSIEWPLGLAFDVDGNLYVSTVAARIEKFDDDLNHVAGWDGPPGFEPGALAISPATGLIHVVDYASETVQVFTTRGTHCGTYPVGEYPTGIAVDAVGRIYVGSDDNRRLIVLKSSGTLLTTLDRDNTPELPWVSDLIFDQDGKLVIAGFCEAVKRFSQTAGHAGASDIGKKSDKQKH